MEREYLGKDDNGYKYFLDRSNLYVYQQTPITDEWVGWLCSWYSWETTFKKILFASLTIESLKQ